MIEREISAKWDIPALHAKLERMGKHPILIFKRPLNADGERVSYPLIANIFGSRRGAASLLGSGPKGAAAAYEEKASRRITPRIISKGEAPVREVVMKNGEVALNKFPIVWYNEMDPGPYITSGNVTTYDPETGIRPRFLKVDRWAFSILRQT